jgi:hypothetical protein
VLIHEARPSVEREKGRKGLFCSLVEEAGEEREREVLLTEAGAKKKEKEAEAEIRVATLVALSTTLVTLSCYIEQE